MSERVKPSPGTKRRYDASGRQAQARRTRAAVLAAAGQRFLADGYATTTVATVARDAAVSVEMIYKAFGNKAGLLKAVFDVAVVGDDEPVPMLQREFVLHTSAEPDLRKKLRMFGEFLAAASSRAAPVQLLARAAAASDPDAAGVWEQIKAERLFGMAMFAQNIIDSGQVRAGLSVDRVRDLLWIYNSAEMYELVTIERGWSLEEYGRFVAESLIAAIAA